MALVESESFCRWKTEAFSFDRPAGYAVLSLLRPRSSCCNVGGTAYLETADDVGNGGDQGRLVSVNLAEGPEKIRARQCTHATAMNDIAFRFGAFHYTYPFFIRFMLSLTNHNAAIVKV